jgi:polyhydroxyalkanoate synthesis repressor PhaR
LQQANSEGTTVTRIIKKYPNRRLYDTETSTYITLAEIKQFVLEYQDFQVQDARSAEDLTRSILLQIILEEESGGVPMFSGDMLANVIRYYGHSMQGLMGNYLERSIHAFHEAQQKFQDSAKKLVVGDYPKFGPEAWQKLLNSQGPGLQNMLGDYLEKSASSVVGMQEELRKQAMQLFSIPLGAAPGASQSAPVPPVAAKANSGAKASARKKTAKVKKVTPKARPGKAEE